VKFEEPGKENVQPVKRSEQAANGLRGRPAKKGAAAAAKTSSNKSAPGGKKPLSPKKVTQVPVSRDYESEDELAADGCQATMKSLQRSPVKPPSKAAPTTKSDDLLDDGIDLDSTMLVNDAILNAPALGATSLASPARRMASSSFKDAMKSPARRTGLVTIGGLVLNSTQKPLGSQMQSPFKSSLLQSAAKRPPSPIKGLQMGTGQKPEQQLSAFKASLLQSPAKKAVPGMKLLSQSRSKETVNDINASPTAKSSAQALPSTGSQRPSEKLLLDEDLMGDLNGGDDDDDDDDDEVFKKPMANIHFPGRLSAVLPREVDPDDDSSIFDEQSENGHRGVITGEDEPHVAQVDVDTPSLDADNNEQLGQSSQAEVEAVAETNAEEAIVVDEIVVRTTDPAEQVDEHEASSSQTPAQPGNPIYRLRQKDLDPCEEIDSDDEDDATLHTGGTPTSNSLAIPSESRRSSLGFTTLADQFGAWSATSPVKSPAVESMSQGTELPKESAGFPSGTSPLNVNFFEDEMIARHDGHDLSKAKGIPSPAHPAGVVEDPVFDDVMVVDEDIALAQEARNMSFPDPKQDQSQDDSLSDASQEYGDENQMPVDPALDLANKTPVTPVRAAMQNLNTTTKVPLKPADESTPSPTKKRSFSASRVAPRRPNAALSRNSTVTSLPAKQTRRTVRQSSPGSVPATPQPVDTSRTDIWSTMGTPARTPRRDLDPSLLRGAVVHVDVHTTEGADASGIFVELLTQMGARCVKTWHWNPNGVANDESTSSKIGITHVVYKDGGRRTLEKVRQSNGVVHCVGVSWVLDCERENRWMEEAPYCIDTSLVPRGGARRRKSMEPKALANMNGTLVNNNEKGDNNMVRGDGQSVPNTPMNRRESTLWMQTPSDQGENEDDDIEWSKFILTPVPKTPAPEAVSRYAAELVETPLGSNGYGDESPTKQTLMTRTCPPKATSRRFMEDELLRKDADEQVLMRLLAARRKSLQFAPKIASPLSKTWD
jgi:hypothetical protein